MPTTRKRTRPGRRRRPASSEAPTPAASRAPAIRISSASLMRWLRRHAGPDSNERLSPWSGMTRRWLGATAGVIGCALWTAAVPATAPGSAYPHSRIKVGGPSAPAEPKVAILGSEGALGGRRYQVLRGDGGVVRHGRLRRAPGKPAPWRHAYRAKLGRLPLGRYRVRVPALDLTSRRWTVRPGGSGNAIDRVLRFFASNRDGTEPSPIHGPAHLDDARVKGGPHGGEHFDLTGGWMDAGDMIHFTQTTSYAAA